MTAALVSDHVPWLYVQNLDHSFDYGIAKILGAEENYRKRLFLEMVHVYQSSNSINFETDINQLSR